MGVGQMTESVTQIVEENDARLSIGIFFWRLSSSSFSVLRWDDFICLQNMVSSWFIYLKAPSSLTRQVYYPVALRIVGHCNFWYSVKVNTTMGRQKGATNLARLHMSWWYRPLLVGKKLWLKEKHTQWIMTKFALKESVLPWTQSCVNEPSTSSWSRSQVAMWQQWPFCESALAFAFGMNVVPCKYSRTCGTI